MNLFSEYQVNIELVHMNAFVSQARCKCIIVFPIHIKRWCLTSSNVIIKASTPPPSSRARESAMDLVDLTKPARLAPENPLVMASEARS